MLSLLGCVEQPEAVVAMTFTRKSAREMRDRIISLLHQAHGPEPDTPHHAQAWRLAKTVMRHAESRNWRLLEMPERLRIQTLDSFAFHLTNQMPLLSGIGGFPEPMEDASPLYQSAVSNTLVRLERATDDRTTRALFSVLLALNNDRLRLRKLMITMLQKRDQWLRHLGTSMNDARNVTTQIEAGLSELVALRLRRFPQEFGWDFLDRLQPVVFSICTQAPEFAAQRELHSWHDRSCWHQGHNHKLIRGLRRLLLGGEGHFYKRLQGFPDNLVAVKQSLQTILLDLSRYPELAGKLVDADRLSTLRIDEKEKDFLGNLLLILQQAYVELLAIFRSRQKVDFVEITLRACQALGQDDDPSALLLLKDVRIQHLLLDEFQDVSRSQYELLRLLTSGWQAGDGRTLFLVGDPMQSIYRFRNADVGLFLKVREEGLGQLSLRDIRLVSNFRSDAAIVDWINDAMSQVLPSSPEPFTGVVSYTRAEAVNVMAQEGQGVHVRIMPDERQEAMQVAGIIKDYRSRHEGGEIAVLVRNRMHLNRILPELARHGLRYQAQDIFPLQCNQSVLDLVSLIHALLHPGDRLHWLACLRAPWTALTLRQMHDLVGDDQDITVLEAMRDKKHVANWDPATRMRVAHFQATMETALKNLYNMPFSLLVEGVWLALSGPAFVDTENELADVDTFFRALGKLGEPQEDYAELLQATLERLYAVAEADADKSLHIMTIHKAKGLEFDCVIIPTMHRSVVRDSGEMLRWDEFRLENQMDSCILMAPMNVGQNGSKSGLYEYLYDIDKRKSRLEAQRLLYVGMTRARHELYLLASMKTVSNSGKKKVRPRVGTFLHMLWPAFAEDEKEVRQEMSTDKGEHSRTGSSGLLVPGKSWKPRADFSRFVADHVSGHTQYQIDPDDLKKGSLIHRYLDILHKDGIRSWPEERVRALLPAIRSALVRLGLADRNLTQASIDVRDALLRVIQNPESHRLLDRTNKNSVSEMPISEPDEHRIFRYKLDLTFMDEDGRQVVIDWKNSRPGSTETVDNFRARQERQYRKQMETYARLCYRMGAREVITRLYFPFVDSNT